MSSSSAAIIAVDVGGTTIKSVLLTTDGKPVARDVRPTEHAIAAQRAVRDAAADLTTRARQLRLDVVGAGVVSPGIVDEDAGLVRYASNLDWRNVPLRELMTSATGGAPVIVGHDARSAGIAEGVFGVARGRRDYAHISIGTGIAASLVVGGSAVVGANSGAGEMGHTPVHPDGEPCTCGQRGCLEVYASGAGLARRYHARTGEMVTARDLVGRLDHDAPAQQVWEEGVRALALALATSILLLEPELIVLGGGLAMAHGKLLDPLREKVQHQLTWRTAPPVLATALGTEAASMGAALLAMRSAGREDAARRWVLGSEFLGGA